MPGTSNLTYNYRLIPAVTFTRGILIAVQIGLAGVFEDGNNLVPTFGSPAPGRSSTGRLFGLLHRLNEAGIVDAAFLPDVE